MMRIMFLHHQQFATGPHTCVLCYFSIIMVSDLISKFIAGM